MGSADAAAATGTALAAFGIDGWTCAPVPSFSHDVLFVAASGRDGYLKRYPASMEERVDATVRLAEHVAASGIAAPAFHRTAEGQAVARVEGYLFTLSRPVGRETLWQSPDCGSASLPSFLAKLHRILAAASAGTPVLHRCPAMWDSYNLDARLAALAAYFRRAFDARAIEFRAIVDEIARLSPRIVPLHEIDTPRGLLHGDFWPGNIVRTGPATDALGIVDFDDSFNGPLLLDVVQFADLANATVADGVKLGIDLEAASLFARRYAAEAGLSSRALTTLPAVLVAARVSSALWIMQRHMTAGPSPLDALADNDIRTIRFVFERMGQWQDELAREATVA